MKRKRRVTGSITVRLPAALQRRFTAMAKARGESPSDLVWGLIEVEPTTMPTPYERSAHVFAQLTGDPTLPHCGDARELEEWIPNDVTSKVLLEIGVSRRCGNRSAIELAAVTRVRFVRLSAARSAGDGVDGLVPRLPMDFVDALLVAFGEEENIAAIRTLDRPGFATYRIRGRGRVRLLPE